jgi:hypothetical protein
MFEPVIEIFEEGDRTDIAEIYAAIHARSRRYED